MAIQDNGPGIVAAQVALTTVLLAGGVLFQRSFAEVLAVDPGFEPDGLVAVEGWAEASTLTAIDLGKRQGQPELQKRLHSLQPLRITD